VAAPMKITLRRESGAKFTATNAAGNTLVVDGPPDVGGVGAGMRPMEVLLASLASCSAVDVLLIMQKQRQPLTDLDVEVEGLRADAVPAVYTDIHLTFTGGGDIQLEKLQRAVELSAEKYCSVSAMLEPKVKITFTARLKASAG
jgi:putative redox protein